MKKAFFLVALFAFAVIGNFAHAGLIPINEKTTVVNVDGVNTAQVEVLNELKDNTFQDCDLLTCEVKVKLTSLKTFDLTRQALDGGVLSKDPRSNVHLKNIWLVQDKQRVISTPIYETTLEQVEFNVTNNVTGKVTTNTRVEPVTRITGYDNRTENYQEKVPVPQKVTMEFLNEAVVIFEFERRAQIGVRDDITFDVLGESFTQYAWWNSTWVNKKPIYINLSTGATVQNYTVLINVSYTAGMRQDSDPFGDLRFVNGSEDTSLPYWIENYVNSSYANVWVKVDQNITTNNYTIYMYYNNPSAANQSNGDTTFPFFDDFPGSSLNTTKWTVATGTGYQVTGGFLYMSNVIIRSNTNMSVNSSIHMNQRNGLNTAGGAFFLYYTNRQGTSRAAMRADDYIQYQEFSNASYIDSANEAGSSGLNTTTDNELTTMRLQDVHWTNTFTKYINPSLSLSTVTQIPDENLHIAFSSSTISTNDTVDYIFNRYFQATEPTYSFGTAFTFISTNVSLVSPINGSNNSAGEWVSNITSTSNATGAYLQVTYLNGTVYAVAYNTTTILNNSNNTFYMQINATGIFYWNTYYNQTDGSLGSADIPFLTFSGGTANIFSGTCANQTVIATITDGFLNLSQYNADCSQTIEITVDNDRLSFIEDLLYKIWKILDTSWLVNFKLWN